MQIDYEIAGQILEEEATSANGVPAEWVTKVSNLSAACDSGANKTFIAALGTALLARATNPLADPFSLQVGNNEPGGYSARALCKDVLAARAPMLGIDLGVTGREPLNNQPFYAEPRIDFKVQPKAEAGYRILRDALTDLSSMTAPQARDALRAFLQVRRKTRYQGALSLAEGERGVDWLVAAVQVFVAADAEGGKRAQSVVAGLLDVVAPGRVVCGRINDPGRHFAGDVQVLDGQTGRASHAFEVRDKRIAEHDLDHLSTRAAELACPRVCMVAVGGGQARFQIDQARNRAWSMGIFLEAYFGWSDCVHGILFWTTQPPARIARTAAAAIHARALQLEVSEAGLRMLEQTLAT